MKENDLLISESQGNFEVKVTGRANFEYAVPLRAMAQKITGSSVLKIDLALCEAMDSTFMGVLTMLALKLCKAGNTVQLLNAGDNLKKLLRDLGVVKFFDFRTGQLSGSNTEKNATAPDMLTTAQTIVEAHKTLVAADDANAAKFEKVIEFAEQDVKALSEKQGK